MNSLYTISNESRSKLNKFRFQTGRSDVFQALVYEIKSDTYEILQESQEVIKSVEELTEELPDNTPRFIVLCYPTTGKYGVKTSPLVMVYYRPQSANQDKKMLYAGAVELMRDAVAPTKFLEFGDIDDFEDLADHF